MIKKPLVHRTKSSSVVVRNKSRRRQMLSPEAVAAEEKRYRIKKILAQSPRLNSQLATQLCWTIQPGIATSCLTQFDRKLAQREKMVGTTATSVLTDMVEDIGQMMDACAIHLAQMHENTGSITLHNNLSARPVIFPPEPIGRYKPLLLTSTFAQEHALLDKLQQFDLLICDALLLRKFGFLDAAQWNVLIRPITERWCALFRSLDYRYNSCGSFFNPGGPHAT